MKLLRLLFSAVPGVVWVAVGAVAGAFTAFFRGYSEGIEREQGKQKARELERLKRQNEIDQDLAYLGDDAVDDELRKYIKKRDKR